MEHIIFFDEEVRPIVEALYDRIKDKVKTFVYMSENPGLPRTKIAPLYEYEKLIKDKPKTYDWPDLNEDTYAVLYYTTGTTGLPKGAMFTNRQVFLANLHLVALGNFDVRRPTDPSKDNFPVVLANVPLFHIHAWQAPFHNVLAANKLVFPGKFTPQNFCELVQTEKVTRCGMVPMMLAMIISYPHLDNYDLSSLKNITVGGGALPIGLKRKAEKVFPGMQAGGGYGMTETLALALAPRLMRYMENWPEEPEEQDCHPQGHRRIPGQSEKYPQRIAVLRSYPAMRLLSTPRPFWCNHSDSFVPFCSQNRTVTLLCANILGRNMFSSIALSFFIANPHILC